MYTSNYYAKCLKINIISSPRMLGTPSRGSVVEIFKFRNSLILQLVKPDIVKLGQLDFSDYIINVMGQKKKSFND